jgi:HEAT repeat protein
MSTDQIAALIQGLKDPSAAVRSRSARALGQIGPEAKEAAPALIQALKEQDEGVRYWATRALGQIGRGAVPELIQALKDQDEEVRYWAALALGEIGPAAKDAIPALMEARDSDGDRNVRAAAATAVVRVNGGE